jgi:branched-subunit amino acid transport protein
MNKKGNWTLSAILGVAGILAIVLPLLTDLSKWFILLGIVFLVLAFIANR